MWIPIFWFKISQLSFKLVLTIFYFQKENYLARLLLLSVICWKYSVADGCGSSCCQVCQPSCSCCCKQKESERSESSTVPSSTIVTIEPKVQHTAEKVDISNTFTNVNHHRVEVVVNNENINNVNLAEEIKSAISATGSVPGMFTIHTQLFLYKCPDISVINFSFQSYHASCDTEARRLLQGYKTLRSKWVSGYFHVMRITVC